MAEVMCIVGHIVDNLKSFSIDECVLVHPTEFISKNVFQSVTKQPADSRLSRWLGSLEGSYLYYGPDKKKCIRRGRASGLGKDACFGGRRNTHENNSRSSE